MMQKVNMILILQNKKVVFNKIFCNESDSKFNYIKLKFKFSVTLATYPVPKSLYDSGQPY